MAKRTWHIECPKCKKAIDKSIGEFRLIVQTDLEFALKPEFQCMKCNQKCNVELKGES